jgi:hypothetical protein
MSEGPLPRAVATALVAFVVARVLTAGLVPLVVALLAGALAFSTKYWRGPRSDR